MTAAKKKAKKQAKRKTARKAPSRPHSPVLDAGLPKALGIKLLTLTRKRITAEMVVQDMHLNRTGRVAGGAIMSFADVLGAVGAVYHRPPGYRGGTVESKTNFFAAGRGPVLRAVTVPLHVGRTTSVWQTSVKNVDGALVAVVTQTQIQLPREPGEGERT
jgi:uncharacterized protein (TIGR00369 family)